MSRFFYILLGYFAGFLGIAFGFILHLCVIASINSFGVSFLSPYSPASETQDLGYFLSPIWRREKRRDFLNTKRENKEPPISLKWKNS